MRNKFIGIGGVSRAGKNLFYDISARILHDVGITCKALSLAHCLKSECEPFIRDKLGLNVWSEITDEKEQFRPMLIWFGDVKRKQTNGRHWIDSLSSEILSCKNPTDVSFITDIRYDVYDQDELSFLKNELGGKLIHISKYTIQPDGTKLYTLPNNKHELENDPRILAGSDVKFEWETVDGSYVELLNNQYLNNKVSMALQHLNIIK